MNLFVFFIFFLVVRFLILFTLVFGIIQIIAIGAFLIFQFIATAWACIIVHTMGIVLRGAARIRCIDLWCSGMV